MTITLSLGKYGGFYFRRGWSTRLCLGWMAITYFPADMDEMFGEIFTEEIAKPKPFSEN